MMKIVIVESGGICRAVKKSFIDDSFFIAAWNEGEPIVKKVDEGYWWSTWSRYLNSSDVFDWYIKKEFISIGLPNKTRDSIYFGFFWQEKDKVFMFCHEKSNNLKFITM